MPESESREMYLKSIYELEPEGELVPISMLAKRLGVSAISATEMLKRLAAQNLVEHTPYKGVVLTDEGLRRALNVVRKQRLWERFLGDHLNLNWAQLYDLSCRLEHATDTVVADSLAEFLGHPDTCPHGNHIPSPNGTITKDDAAPLINFTVGQVVQVTRIDRPETTLCNYLEEREVFPGQMLELVDEAPYNGPITVLMNKKEIALGREISSRIFVTLIEK